MQSETTGHTPGPWKVLETVKGKRYSVSTDNGAPLQAVIASMDHESVNVPVEAQGANARLIAAAPTMLEALDDAQHHLRSLLDNHYDGGRIVLYAADINALEARIGDIRAAIAKALGS